MTMHDLTDTERIAFTGIQARQQQLQIEQTSVLRAIEARLHLAPGAIGTTHQLDTQWRVSALPRMNDDTAA